MAVIFHPPFPESFFPDGIFFGRHLRHLFVIRFIKNTLTTMFTITGITSKVITFIVSFKKRRWQKRIYSCPLKAISDASLCILYTAFLQKLYFARVSHGMVQFVLKMRHLSILMEPTLLLEKASATVSYNAFRWCWYLNVACMLAALVTRTESYVYVVEQA